MELSSPLQDAVGGWARELILACGLAQVERRYVPTRASASCSVHKDLAGQESLMQIGRRLSIKDEWWRQPYRLSRRFSVLAICWVNQNWELDRTVEYYMKSVSEKKATNPQSGKLLSWLSRGWSRDGATAQILGPEITFPVDALFFFSGLLRSSFTGSISNMMTPATFQYQGKNFMRAERGSTCFFPAKYNGAWTRASFSNAFEPEKDKPTLIVDVQTPSFGSLTIFWANARQGYTPV